MNESDYRQQLFTNEWNLKNSRQEIISAYPDVMKITAIIDFTYDGVKKYKERTTSVYHPQDKNYFKIECINPECVLSDLDLSDEISNMIRQKKSNSKGRKVCHGYQDYERYRSRGNSCLTEMNYTIEIEYK